jgi:hypothetical protein
VQVGIHWPQKKTVVANGGFFRKCTFHRKKGAGMYGRTKFWNETEGHVLSSRNAGMEGAAVKP